MDSADAGIYAEFFTVREKDPIASKEKGYDVDRDVEYIRLILDQYNQPVFKANDQYRRRFDEQYRRFKNKLGSQAIGISIEKAPFLNPGQIKMYERQDIYTIEQLAAITDTRADHIGMGVKEHRKKAAEYIEAKKLSDPFDKQQKTIAELEARIKMMEEEKIKQVSTPSKKSKEERVNL